MAQKAVIVIRQEVDLTNPDIQEMLETKFQEDEENTESIELSAGDIKDLIVSITDLDFDAIVDLDKAEVTVTVDDDATLTVPPSDTDSTSE